MSGRKNATITMYGWAEHCQGPRPDIEAEFRTQKGLTAELTAVATAVAANSAPNLETQLAAAGDIGALPEQIHFAIEIARKIKRVAEDKIEVITRRIGEDTTSAAALAGLSGLIQRNRPEATAGAQPGCGCR